MNAIQIIEGAIAGERRKVAVMLDEASGWAFGPTFTDAEEVRRFLSFLNDRDPRLLDDEDLEAAVAAFRER